MVMMTFRRGLHKIKQNDVDQDDGDGDGDDGEYLTGSSGSSSQKSTKPEDNRSLVFLRSLLSSSSLSQSSSKPEQL